jgi:hypothetical protein
MPQREQLGGERRVAAGQRGQPSKQPNRDQMQQLQTQER